MEKEINNIGDITEEEVINGLKFIAENRSISQEELFNGLMQRGCNFSMQDVRDQFPQEMGIYDAMRKGDLGCGAAIIVNMRDDEDNRSFADERFLSVDDDESIYHFIRVRTGDQSYTKSNIEASKSSGGMSK